MHRLKQPKPVRRSLLLIHIFVVPPNWKQHNEIYPGYNIQQESGTVAQK